MTALVCPSCRCMLKAPEKMAGRTAPCPKCRRDVVVPFVKKVGVALSDSKTHPIVLPAVSADTVESLALESTAVHTPVRVQTAAERRAPARKPGRRRWLRALGAVALAAAAAFALWMAAAGR